MIHPTGNSSFPIPILQLFRMDLQVDSNLNFLGRELEIIGIYFCKLVKKSSMLAMWTALDWRSSLGEENIMNYIHELAVWTGHTLAGSYLFFYVITQDMWNTSVLVEDDMIGMYILLNEMDRSND